MKKNILIILTVMMTLFLLSCSEGAVTDSAQQLDSDTVAVTDTSDTASADKGKLIADPDGTKYAIIVPKDAKNLFSYCQNVKAEIFSITSRNVYVKYDSSQEEGQYEILVGLTNREQSKNACSSLETEQYHISWDADKLLIAAGSNYAAKAGIKWLLENHIKGTEGDALYIPWDLDKKGSANMNLNFEGLASGWSPLVYPAQNGVELQYQIYMPKNYDKTKEYPCILYMHSAGVRCDDNSHIYTGEAKFLRNFEQGKYANEAIIIAPCCPEGEKWVPAKTWKEITYDLVNTDPTQYMSAVTELWAQAREKLSIDGSRLYLYGMSMGGFATWDLLTRNPDMFAAAIPVAGAGDPSVVGKLSGTSIWIFHGTADEAVPFASGQAMYDALTAAGRTDVKFTKFEGAGHGIWSKTADTDGLYDWLFSCRRS